MSDYINEKAKALAAELGKAQMANASMTQGYVGGGMALDEPCKAPLRDRIGSRARRAGNEARRAENLKELQYLLDKNPEVARILELLEAAGERDFV